MKFGERLQHERQRLNLTQAEVASQLSVARQTISAWENERSYPDIQNLVALSDLYALSLDILLREDDVIMEHMKTNSKIVDKSILISQIAYFANIGLLTAFSLQSFINMPSILTKGLTPLFFLNIVVLCLFKQILYTKKFSYKKTFKLVGGIVIIVFIASFFAITTHLNNPYEIGHSMGQASKVLLQTISLCLIFFPTKTTN